MAPSVLDHPCLGGGSCTSQKKSDISTESPSVPSLSTSATKQVDWNVAHEGLLRYQSKGGEWKERWFVLDSTDNILIKCVTSGRQRSYSFGSVLGQGVRIDSVQALSNQLMNADAVATSQQEQAPVLYGFDVISKEGQTVRFLTREKSEELYWIAAIHKQFNGFTPGVADRLADRELLAGKYALVRELGRGASGIVSLYTYRGKPFAIKKFVPQKSRTAPNRRIVPGTGLTTPKKEKQVPEEVRREIALLKKASHLPYVIKLHDVILDADLGNYYLVMEYMGGGAIADWDGERKCYVCSHDRKSVTLLNETTLRSYMTNLLLGIQALHQNRLCHRDIKPENIMSDEGHTICKIGDLGVAHYFREENGVLLEEENPDSIALWNVEDSNSTMEVTDANTSTALSVVDLTHSNKLKGMLKSTKGTYQFLPPEALGGDEFDGFKADIWAIGVTMYALSFGYLPWFSVDVLQLFEKIENDPLVIPANCQDVELVDLLQRILEKNPEKRATLEDILNHQWFHRNVDSKALQRQVRALKRSPALALNDGELGGAVSVLQSRFDVYSHAVQHNNLGEIHHDSELQHESQEFTNEGFVHYQPHPVQIIGVTLPKWIADDVDALAAQLHFNWCQTKHLNGWTYGAERDDSRLFHPFLLPMRDLPSEAKEKNVRCVVETLKCVLALGCHVCKSKDLQKRLTPTGSTTLSINPFSTDQVTLSWDMLMLVDLLAENSHEVWAEGCMREGWVYGPEFEANAKTHPSLRPYMSLDETEKEQSREGVSCILKSCMLMGYQISCSRVSQ